MDIRDLKEATPAEIEKLGVGETMLVDDPSAEDTEDEAAARKERADAKKAAQASKAEKAAAQKDDDEDSSDEDDEEGDTDASDEDKEEDDEEEEEPAAKKRGNKKGVPYSRFVSVLEKSHAKDAELAALRAEKAVRDEAAQRAAVKDEPKYDFKAKEKEYAKLVFAADDEKAAELRAEINAELSKAASSQSKREMQEEIAKLREEQKMVRAQAEVDLVAAEIWKDHPFLDHNSKKANREAIDELVEMRDFYITSKGLSAGEALRKAAKIVVPQYSDATPSTSKTQKSADREAEAERRAAEASERTPPSAGKAGVGSKGEKISERNYTPKQWMAMTDAERDAYGREMGALK